MNEDLDKPKRTKPKMYTNVFLQDVPATTYAAFKSACAMKGKPIKVVLIKFMRHYYRRKMQASKKRII